MKKIYDKRKIRKALDIDIYPRGGGKIDLRVFADTADSVSLGSEVESKPASNDSTIFGDSEAYVAIITNPYAQASSDYEYEYINVNDYYEFQDGFPVNVKSTVKSTYENVDIGGIVYKSNTDLNETYKISDVKFLPVGPSRFEPSMFVSKSWALNEDGYYAYSRNPGSSPDIT